MTKQHIVHTESSGGWGGQEIRILTEAREFIRMGYKVTLVCADEAPIAERAAHYGLSHVELPIGKKTFKGLIAMCRWMKENDFDLINSHSSTDSWYAALAIRITGKRTPLVRTRHVSSPVSNNLATTWLYRKAADFIVTTGEILRNTLIQDNQINPDKIKSVPTGIDTEVFIPGHNVQALRAQLGLPQEKKIIGILATLRSWKGHQYLLQAFAAINDPDTHLLIVGDGPQWDNIKQQILALKLEDKVTMTGNQHDVAPWLQSMDIFVLPSYANEGVPQSLMQAMACGLAVISTPVGSITEIINTSTGLLVSPRSSDEIQAAIQSLLDDPDLIRQLGKNANTFAMKNCGLEKMALEMETVFSSLLNKNTSQ